MSISTTTSEDKKTFLRGISAALGLFGAFLIMVTTLGIMGVDDDKEALPRLMLGFSLGLGYYFSFTGIMGEKFYPTHIRLSIALLISFLFPLCMLFPLQEDASSLWYTIDFATSLAASAVAFAAAGFSAGTLLRHWLS